MATSDRLPIVSEDEADYADPGVTLALDGHFGSNAFWYQRGNDFWAVQPPELLDSTEMATISVLVLDRATMENTIARIGGNWKRTGSFSPVLDSMPRRFGFGERGYDLIVLRRRESGGRE